MLQITLLVASLADSVNPVTIALGLYLASGERPHARVAAFTAGVLGVYGLGGAALLLGPGQLLRTAVSSSDTRAFHTVSIAGGAALVILALVIMRRGRSAGITATVQRLGPRSALALGATVTVLDLPTAFPYFAAIAAVAGRRWNAFVHRARLGLDRFAPAAVAALTAVMGGGLIVRGADGLLG